MNSINFFNVEFLSKYATKEVPFGPLGYVTYKRTYARYLEDLGRTEEWWETCTRVLTGNFALEARRMFELCGDGPFYLQQLKRLKEEAEQAYDDMFHLKWLPPGRGLWVSGTDTGNKNGGALTNCYYVDIKPYHGKTSYPFCFAMDELMLGAGVGFGVSKKNINQFPVVANPVDLFIVCKEDHRDYQFLNAQNKEGDWWNTTHQKIHIWDCREGWVYALKKTIEASFLSKRVTDNKKTVVIDVSDVRPSGDRISGFGGMASGPAPLAEMLRAVNRLFNNRVGQRLTPVDCTDIMTLIGRCVVSGNVRRSAMIALGDGDDKEFIFMKNPIDPLAEILGWTEEQVEYHNFAVNNNRWASNNSILVDKNFDHKAVAESIWVKGEPGWLNTDLTQNYGRLVDGRISGIDAKATGTNPCGEISLESFEPCNLAEIFPSNCQSLEELKRVTLTAYRYAKRVTMSPYPWEESQEVVERNRRVGVSISGIQDWLLNLSKNVPGADPNEIMADTMSILYGMVSAEDLHFSKQLQINKSIKLTTVKPSGTISLLAGVSPGIHYPYAQYYIRRIQFQDTDPMVPYLESLGFTVTDAVQTPRAKVVQFPIKARTSENIGFKSAGEVTAREQLELQHLVQKYWADNQVSCTISFKETDRQELPDLIQQYSKVLKSTSFLPYTENLKAHYPDLPYEPITCEIYNQMMSKVKHWPSRLTQDSDGLEIDNDECVGGMCPIK
jgi:ribonucleoside-triphosphate reductase